MRKRSCELLLLGLLTAFACSAPSLSQAQTDDAEISFWNSVKDSNDAAELNAYLEAYPNGVFAPLAKIRLNSLGADAATNPKQEEAPTESASKSQSADKPPIHDCDRLAANPGDGARVGKGVPDGEILPGRAIAACKEAVANFPDEPRFVYQLARARYAQGEYASANEVFRELAKKDYAIAMVHLGFSFAQGNGLDKDDQKAVEWYQKAADLDNALAFNNLGVMYGSGRGVPKELKKSVSFYKKAAELGDIVAMSNLGGLYLTGNGVKKDPKLGVRWISRAAELGDRNGYFNLAYSYDNGLGVAKDREQAAEYMLKALKADLEHARNQMLQNSSSWSAEFRRELQRLLKEEGYYSGAIDGAFGPATRAAIEGLMSSVEVTQPSPAPQAGEAGQQRNNPELELPDVGNINELETLD